MLRRRGIRFVDLKLFLAFNSGLILDLLPFVNMFAWTLDMLLVIAVVNGGREVIDAAATAISKKK